MEGATNWFSTSFNPATGLYYVQTLQKCTVYTQEPGEWQAGKSYYGGSTKEAPDDPLWHFQANTLWKASPMTYMFDGKQHIAVASGPNIISFALVE